MMSVTVGRALLSRARLLLMVVAVLAAWEVAGRLLALPIPPPSRFVGGALDFVQTSLYQESLLATVRRSLVGFAVACTLAVPLGLLSGVVPQVEWLLSWVLGLFRPISPLAWIPMAIIWFGFTETAGIFIVALTVFFPVALNSIAAIRTVPPVYVEGARLLGANRMMLVGEVLWPAILPDIITGMRIGLVVAFSVIVAAELIISASVQLGLGYLLYYNTLLFFRLDNIITLAVTLGILGSLINEVFVRLQQWITPWTRGVREAAW